MLTAQNAATIYLCPGEGWDRNNGFSPAKEGGNVGPFNTFNEALHAISEMRHAGAKQPFTLCLSGDYYLNSPIRITTQDENGIARSEATRLVITSMPGTRARIIGGRKLTGFAKDTFNGHDCFSVAIPDVKAGKWVFSDLYVNGMRAHPSRWPAQGTFDAETTEFPNPVALFNGSHWFVGKKADLAGLSGIENATINFYHYWIDEHTPVEKYDPKTGRIDMKYRSTFQMTTDYEHNDSANFHYYFENMAQGFTKPGDWFLDVAAGKLYYMPIDNAMTPDNVEVFAPTTDKLFEFIGTPETPVTDIRLEDLDLLCTRGEYAAKMGGNDGAEASCLAADCQSVCGAHGAVNFQYASGCVVHHCRLFDTGLHGINVEKGCHDIRIEDNYIHDVGAGGIRILGGAAGEADAQMTTHVVVRGNRIAHGSQRYAAGCGILAMHTAYNEFSENDISYMDYSGVSVGWIWGYAPSSSHHNLVRHNHIHHIGNGLLSDMGGIYTLGLQPGTVLEDNIIHNVNSNHYGGWGIYPDEGSSYLLIQNNLIFDTKSECFHQHYGSFNTVRNNIFAFGGDHVARNSRPEAHLSTLFEHNIFITKGVPIYNVPPASMQANSNVVWNVEGKNVVMFDGLSLADWQKKYGRDEGTVVKNPHIDVYKLAEKRIAAIHAVDLKSFEA